MRGEVFVRKLNLGFAGLSLDGEWKEGLKAGVVRYKEEGLVGAYGFSVIFEGECEPEGFSGGESEGGRERLGRREAMGESLSASSCEDTIAIEEQ